MTVTASSDDQLMCTATHRYCLGRSTYIVGSCLTWLRATRGDFDSNTRNVMYHDAGHPMDERGRVEFARWAWPLLDDKGRLWVRTSTAYEEKPWPLDEEQSP